MSLRLLWLLIILGALLVYPAVLLAHDEPHFPHRGECVHPATADGEVDAVFGRFDDRGAATAEAQRLAGLGFTGTAIEGDGCGYLKVVVHGVPSLAVGSELVAEARRVGVPVTLEQPAT
jgi:hypothetical protein